MGPHRVYPSVVQYHDLVRVHDGQDTLGDDQLCHGGDGLQSLSYPALCGRVHGAGGVVKDEDLRPF